MSKERITVDGEGSIVEVERGRVYRIRHRLPPKVPGGKRRWSPMRTVHGNKAKARIELEAYRTELEDELNNEHASLKVGDFAREFHQRRIDMGTLSPLSLERDEIEIRRIEEYFADTRIQDLGATEINNAYAKARRAGLSASALHKLHAKLHQVLKQAVKEEIIIRNPCELIDDVKRPEAAERRSLSDEQAARLALDLRECPRSGRIVAVWLALATGVRRGEALGLIWENVDLVNKRIYVDKQLDSRGIRRDPKSRKSKRNLAIDDGTVRFLTEWKIMQSDMFFDGGDVAATVPICTNEHGEFICPTSFDKWRRQFFVDHGLGEFEKVETWHDRNGVKRYRKTGYRGFNLHELRHTQATLLIGQGADIKTVQNRLGHSSASLTMNIYAHAIEQNDRDAADTIGGLLDL